MRRARSREGDDVATPMTAALAIGISLVFAALAVWHFRMAWSITRGGGLAAAVPRVEGKPLFVPSMRATVAVGLALPVCAALVAATAGVLHVGISQRLLSWTCLALGLLARAIGEFRYVGFFKRVRGSRFARLDPLLYSPLCLLLASAIACVAARRGL